MSFLDSWDDFASIFVVLKFSEAHFIPKLGCFEVGMISKIPHSSVLNLKTRPKHLSFDTISGRVHDLVRRVIGESWHHFTRAISSIRSFRGTAVMPLWTEDAPDEPHACSTFLNITFTSFQAPTLPHYIAFPSAHTLVCAAHGLLRDARAVSARPARAQLRAAPKSYWVKLQRVKGIPHRHSHSEI